MGYTWKYNGEEYPDNMSARHLSMSLAQVEAPLLRPVTTHRIKPKCTVVRYGTDAVFKDEFWFCGWKLAEIFHAADGVYEFRLYQPVDIPKLFILAASRSVNKFMYQLRWLSRYGSANSQAEKRRNSSSLPRGASSIEGFLPEKEGTVARNGGEATNMHLFCKVERGFFVLGQTMPRPFRFMRFNNYIDLVFFKKVDATFGDRYASHGGFVSIDGEKVMCLSEIKERVRSSLRLEADWPAVFSSQGQPHQRVVRTEEKGSEYRAFVELLARYGLSVYGVL